MADITACLSTGKDDWETPDELFAVYNERYQFFLDAAANHTNAKCSRWFGPGSALAEDALTVNWPLEEGNIWLNPPYSRGLQARFVEKALTKLFHDVILASGADVTFLRGRVRFKGAPAGAPFPSMIVVF
jgi:phage N-6-adenine-methyltransferase